MSHRSFSSQLNHIAALLLLLAFVAPVLPAFAQEACAPLLRVDTPSANSDVLGQIGISGWALDQNVTDGSGISSVEVYLDGTQDQGGVALGATDWGARPDIDERLSRSGISGYSLTTDASLLSSGIHTFYVYAWTACGPVISSVDVVAPAPSASAPGPAPAPAPRAVAAPTLAPVTADFFVIDAPTA